MDCVRGDEWWVEFVLVRAVAVPQDRVANRYCWATETLNLYYIGAVRTWVGKSFDECAVALSCTNLDVFGF